MSQIRILAVAAGRGGTGKSTLAFAVADALRRLDPAIDVALVDLDPQAGLPEDILERNIFQRHFLLGPVTEGAEPGDASLRVLVDGE